MLVCSSNRKLSLILVLSGVLCLSSPLSAAEDSANRIVYWGNIYSGMTVRVVNKPDAERIAKAQVEKLGGSGWIMVENSTAIGFGAAFCKKTGETIEYFTAHGLATGREAVTEAKRKAGGGSALCNNALWRVNPPAGASVPGAFGSVQGMILRAAGARAEQCFRPRGAKDYRPMQAADDPAKGDIKTCPLAGDVPTACMCVRG